MITMRGNRNFAQGLKWVDFASSGEANSYVRAEKKPYIKIQQTEQDNAKSVAVGTYPDTRVTGRVYCAAMAVGVVLPNVIIHQTVGEDQVWFAAVTNGVPYSGLDEIVGSAKATALLQEFYSGAGFSSHIVGDVPGAQSSLDEALDAFEQQVQDARLTKKQLAALQLQAAPSTFRVLLILALLGALCAAGAVGVWLYQRAQAQEESRRAAISNWGQAQEEGKKLEGERARSLDAFEQQVQAKRAQIGSPKAGPVALWHEWERIRRSLPFSVRGYTPLTMACTKATCLVSWIGSGIGVRIEDKASIPGWVQDSEPTLVARSEVAVTAPTGQSPLTNAMNLDAGRLRLYIAQALQFSTQSVQVSAAAPVVLTPPPELKIPAVTLGAIGSVRFTVTGAIAANDAIRALTRLPVALEAVRWDQLNTATPTADVVGVYAAN